MAKSIKIAIYANSDDAFVAWAPDAIIANCLGFQLERGQRTSGREQVVIVQNRVGFAADKAKSGDPRSSGIWPFQRFNWTDHAVDVGNEVRYRVTAMLRNGPGPLTAGLASDWSPWTKLTPDAGDGFSCYFNRGLILSQFVARYLRAKRITPEELKAGLMISADPSFRAFLQGDLGVKLFQLLSDAKGGTAELHAALYELGDDALQAAMTKLGSRLNLILANGSDKSGDGNADARKRMREAGVPTIDRLLKSKGLGHNKFLVRSDAAGPNAVWTGSTNWSTTGLCTQINNGLLIEDAAIAKHYLDQWTRLRDASPPALDPANFPPELVRANDKPGTFDVGGAKVTVWFTRTSDGRDMDVLRKLIASAQNSILFLMFTPGPDGLHTLAGQRSNEETMYVRGVVSSLGMTKADNQKNVLDVQLVSTGKAFKPDRYSVVQPQGEGGSLGPWIKEVTRSDFLSKVGHAIVHSKILLIDPLGDDPVLVTGSHNFSGAASKKNDENFVIVRGHRQLARAYAAHIMSVYQHYRYRSYIREMESEGKTPWSQLSGDDNWLRAELKSKAREIAFWT